MVFLIKEFTLNSINTNSTGCCNGNNNNNSNNTGCCNSDKTEPVIEVLTADSPFDPDFFESPEEQAEVVRMVAEMQQEQEQRQSDS